MSARFLTQLLSLTAATLFVFFWTKDPLLAPYTPQLIAFLGLLYFGNRYLFRRRPVSFTFDGAIFAAITLLLVSQTGGLDSPLFFLFYLLLFGLALFLEPIITLIFITLLVFYFSNQIQDLNSLLQLIGLLLVTPLALFFGRQYLLVLQGEEKIRIIARQKEELAQEMGEKEEDTLLWISLTFREHVVRILDSTSEMLANLSHLTQSQKENLQKIHESAKRLLKLGQRLREKIEN